MRHLFASLALSAAAFASGILAPATLPAQQTASFASARVAPSEPVATPATPAPMVRSDIAGITVGRDTKAPLKVNAAAETGLHQGQGVALMAVGGAGLIAGLLIGGSAGTAVAVGGLAVGVVGLYEFVR